MPREGYRSITVKDDVYSQLEKIAEGTHRTVPEVIEHLVKTKKELEA